MEERTRQPDFDDLARELSGPLHHYLERYVGEPSLADDLLQETLIRMQRGLSHFRQDSSPKTWAFSIATHVAADHFRQPDHRQRIVDVDEIDVPDTQQTGDERMVVGEMNACVRQVIDSLPEDYRAALVLHDLEGLSAEQVAQICKCSMAAAKIRIHRARSRLKGALQRQCDFYRDKDNVFRCDRKA